MLHGGLVIPGAAVCPCDFLPPSGLHQHRQERAIYLQCSRDVSDASGALTDEDRAAPWLTTSPWEFMGFSGHDCGASQDIC